MASQLKGLLKTALCASESVQQPHGAERNASSGRLLQANERRALGAGSVVGSFTSSICMYNPHFKFPFKCQASDIYIVEGFPDVWSLLHSWRQIEKDEVEAAEAEISYISHNATQLHLY